MNDKKGLSRSLSSANIQLIALGGAIGTGLFLGSSTAISLAGPSILFAYIASGIVIFLLMRAMGEVLLSDDRFTSIGDFVQAFLGPRMGFMVGWTYWLCWVTAALAEFTAIGIYIHYWFPKFPELASGLIALALLVVINLSAVKSFGNLESTFSVIKLAVIVLLVILGVILAVMHKTYDVSSHEQVTVGLANLVDYGGLFPHGIKGFLLSFQMVLFGFAGVEMIGLTAGETKNASTNLRKAINALPVRILLFYFGAILAILVITPWNEIVTSQSPFVTAFQLSGIPAAAGIINFTVIIASLSSSNTGIYSTSRILYTSAKNGLLAKPFAKVSKRGIPIVSLLFTVGILLVGLLANFLIPNASSLFTMFASVTTVCFLFVWVTIILAHLKFRREMKQKGQKTSFRMPFYPISDYACIIFFLAVGVLLLFSADTRISIYVGAGWFAVQVIAFEVMKKKHLIDNTAAAAIDETAAPTQPAGATDTAAAPAQPAAQAAACPKDDSHT